MAYSLSTFGSNWMTIKVLHITPEGEGQLLRDELTEVKFSCIAWTHDGKGFFYNRYQPQSTSFVTARQSTREALRSSEPSGQEKEPHLNQELWCVARFTRLGFSVGSNETLQMRKLDARSK